MTHARHAVIIRLDYPTDSPKFEWRLAFFQAMVLPRLLGQNRDDFDIAVRCNPAHAKRIAGLSPRIRTFGVKPRWRGWVKPGYESKIKSAGGRYHVDFVPWEAVVGLPRYEIQTAIDSDDLILTFDFIDRIEQALADVPKGKTAHLCFQPFIFHVPALRTYRCPILYSATKGSAFYSIYQPGAPARGFVFAYDDSHLVIGRQFQRRLFIDDREPIVAFSVHDANESTHLYNSANQVML
jgi:hypothetical protein